MISFRVLFVLVDTEDVIDKINENLDGYIFECGIDDAAEVMRMFLFDEVLVVREIAFELACVLLLAHLILLLLLLSLLSDI